MPKAVLEFSLPEENEEFKLAQQSMDYASVLNELDNILRSKIKYAPDSQHELVTSTCEEIRQVLHELARDRGIDV